MKPYLLMREYYFMKTTEINLVGYICSIWHGRINRSRFEVVRRMNASVHLLGF